ncbi:MAG: MATE family efflux transporter [Treponemataceae bacterium]|nr:MATE family efflux transporter [Treponemataceae bacterium]
MKVGIKNTVDLTEGSIPKKLFLFALPLVFGNLLQQFYNIVDTIVVGKYLGENALAAVGSAYTIMILLTSIIIGLCMGASVCFSMRFGQKDCSGIRQAFFISFIGILIVTVVLNALSYALLDMLIKLMNIPEEIRAMFRQYMLVIFSGIFAVFLYNIFSNLFRAVGNSVIPLAFLAVSTLINVILDLIFIIHCKWGVVGAAAATVIAQYISGIGITIYYFIFGGSLRVRKFDLKWDRAIFKEMSRLSSMTCVQQSIMNFGILMVQGLVNSFGTAVMAAFAAGVKIDTFAYSPVQDFGNAFSSFVAQNYGAQKKERVKKGVKTAVLMVVCFCAVISVVVCLFANQLMKIFIDAGNVAVIAIGVRYLRIEGACYIGIGLLFMFYGYYRAINKPAMSIVLTIISLGVRVALSYILVCCTNIGEISIWMAIPIGWLLADITGIVCGFVLNKKEAYVENRI